MADDNPFLSEKELATVLAALREWQVSKIAKTALVSEYSDYFDGVGVLTDDEIDELCERLNQY